MFSLALLIGAAQERLVDAMRAGTRQIKQWSGVVLLLVGVWLIALAIWAETFARIFPV